jgi:hypothetical protein
MSTMALTLRLLILAVFFFNTFSAVTSLAELESTSTAISSFQISIISRALSTTSAPRSTLLPDDVTQMLSMKDTSVMLLGKRGWTKEQYSIFLGWMIPFGVFVVATLLYIFFGAKIHAAWRKCWGGREGVGATAT